MALKLTPPQLNLLKERKGHFMESYKPGQKLVELGLINAIPRKWGGYCDWTINAEGEAILASLAITNKTMANR